MRQYLLSVYQPDGEPGPEIDLEAITRDVENLHNEMKEAGVSIFAGGLYPASSATVVRERGGEPVITDGPYIEGKEHIGGFTVLEAPDLDAALEWARKSAAATRLPIEVRPIAEGHGR
jgi:hypothetical protein